MTQRKQKVHARETYWGGALCGNGGMPVSAYSSPDRTSLKDCHAWKQADQGGQMRQVTCGNCRRILRAKRRRAIQEAERGE